MNSIIMHPDRGPWGDSAWRGNCSGHVYKDLFTQLQTKSFCDPMAGSFTSVEVASDMGIRAYGLDLHQGFNAVSDSILNEIGEQVDLVLSHPPYGSMIVYSGNVWGDKPHPGDLSRCADDAEFHEKMQRVLLNQRDATLPGKYYGTIIGDYRRSGKYTSYQAEMIARMPSDELAAVLIKGQFNVASEARIYARMELPRISHEYILLWKKKSQPLIVLLGSMAREQSQRVKSTWKAIVGLVLQRLGGEASLPQIYSEVSRAAPEKVCNNEHWQAKVRQVLNSTGLFSSTKRGMWALAA